MKKKKIKPKHIRNKHAKAMRESLKNKRIAVSASAIHNT